MTLKARLLAGVTVVALLVLAASAIIIDATRTHLIDQVDSQLERAVEVGVGLRRPRGPQGSAAGSPGVPDLQEGSEGSETPTLFYVGVAGEDGTFEARQVPNLRTDQSSGPDLTVAAAQELERSGGAVTVPGVDNGSWRVVAGRDPRSGELAIVAVETSDVDTAVTRLVLVVAGADAGVLAGLVLVTWWVLHLGVRPIKHMTEAATAVADGDLSTRIPEAETGTEAEELGQALNVMLERIEDAFAQREASQERLRQFVADASHELRTPITTIRGYAELYRAGGLKGPGELDLAMQRTEQEAVRMGELVNDMLQLARFDQQRAFQPTTFDLGDLVEHVVGDLEANGDRHRVLVEQTGDLTVDGDRDLLQQVVSNLVNNALTYTAGDSTVHVSRDGDTITLVVADDGAGMGPGDVERAFERFWRGDSSRGRQTGGSGLGLAIVKEAVDAHHGKVELASEPGVGTTVTVTLPVNSGTGRPDG
jgi:two-component system OmpR family sensor kinase